VTLANIPGADIERSVEWLGQRIVGRDSLCARNPQQVSRHGQNVATDQVIRASAGHVGAAKSAFRPHRGVGAILAVYDDTLYRLVIRHAVLV